MAFVDLFYGMIRLVVLGQAALAPCRGHLNQRLLDVWLSHPQVVLLIYAMTLGLGALAFITSARAQLASFAAAVILFGVAVLALEQRSGKAEALDPTLYPEDAD